MKVYIVTSGEYSDYGIRAVFTNHKKAELYCATHNTKTCSEECYIEEYETKDFDIESNRIPKRVVEFRCYQEEITLLDRTYFTFDNIDYIHKGCCEIIGCVTVNKNTPEEKVRKIIADKVAKFKAEKLQEE